MASVPGQFVLREVIVGEDENHNFIRQQRLVLRFDKHPSGREFALDCDFGLVFNALIVNMVGTIEPTSKHMVVSVRRVRRVLQAEQATEYFIPLFQYFGEAMPSCYADSMLRWMYWTDGRSELVFGFRPADQVKAIAKKLNLLSLPRNGVSTEMLMLAVSLEDGQQLGLDVSQVAHFCRSRSLHRAPYGEVYEGALMETAGASFDIRQAPSIAVKIVQLGIATPDDPARTLDVLLHLRNHLTAKDSSNGNSSSSSSGRAPHFQELQDVVQDSSNLYISSRMYKQGSLLDWLGGRGRLGEADARELAFHLATSLCLLHSLEVAHMDISPENVVLVTHGEQCLHPGMRQLRPVLIDFGQAVRSAHGLNVRRLPTSRHQPCKKAFRCPEWAPWTKCFTGEHDGQKVDSWQLGVLLFILLTGADPLAAALPRNTDPATLTMQEQVGHWLLAVQRGVGNLALLTGSGTADAELGQQFQFVSLQDTLSPQAAHLLGSLLQIKPAQRMDMEDVLRHPWFHSLALPR